MPIFLILVLNLLWKCAKINANMEGNHEKYIKKF